MPEKKRVRLEENDDEVPLHVLLEYMFDGEMSVTREEMDKAVEKMSHDVPLPLYKSWAKLKKLIDAWTFYQEKFCPNQEHWQRENATITSPLHYCPDGQKSYDAFQNEEELCMMSLPLDHMEKLRSLILLCLSALKNPEQDMPLPPSPSTSRDVDGHTCTSSTIARGATERVDVSPLQGSAEDQIALRFGLVTPMDGTISASSTILIKSPAGWSTLRWQEPVGSNTLELRYWNSQDIADVEPQEQWKYYLEHFKVQVHATTAPEVLEAIRTLRKYTQRKLLHVKPEDVRKHTIQRSHSFSSSPRTRSRR